MIKEKSSTVTQAGFSLIELMVVVAIIGILTAIAVPSFSIMASKARQTEAKAALSGMYTAEMGFYADQGAFTCCLYEAGYEPEANNHYYTTGFWNYCIPWISNYATGASCFSSNIPWGNATRNDATFGMDLWANPILKNQGIGGAFFATSSTFNVVAFGSISGTSANFDVWSIDQTKNTQNLQSGL